MIQDRNDYRHYCEADRLSLGKTRLRPRLLGDEVWRFQRALRAYEYALTKTGPFARIRVRANQARWYLWALVIGVSIHPGCFGPGLSIAHRGTIVVNAGARIGRNCRIHVDVNIGTTAGMDDAAPHLGDNVYIAPGAKLYGPIELADGIVIGANAVVNKSCTTPNVSLAGVPAAIISSKGSEGLLIRGDELAARTLVRASAQGKKAI